MKNYEKGLTVFFILILAVVGFVLFILYFDGDEFTDETVRSLELGVNVAEAIVYNETLSEVKISNDINLSDVESIDFVFYGEGTFNLSVSEIKENYEILSLDIGMENFNKIQKVDAIIIYKKTKPISGQNQTNKSENGKGGGGHGGGGPITCTPSRTCYYYYILGTCGSSLSDGCSNILNCNTCPSGTTCQSGSCVDVMACTNDVDCSSSGSFCDGNLPYTCTLGGDGCLDRKNLSECQTACISGICTQSEEKIIINSPKENIWNKNLEVNFNITFIENPAYGFIDWQNSLIGWYRGENNANDDSGRNNNCQVEGNVGYTTGKFGKAFVLNEQNYIRCPDNISDFQFKGDNSFSISAWVFMSQSGGYFVSKGNGKPGYALFWHGAGRYQFMSGDSYNFPSVFSPDSNPLGKWTLLTAVYDVDEKTIKIYVNGQKAMTSAINPETNIDTMSDLIFGRDYFDGFMDEIMIFNRSLSDGEITSLYNSNNLIKEFEVDESLNYTFDINLINSEGQKTIVSKNIFIDVPNSSPKVILNLPIDSTRSPQLSQVFQCTIKNTNQNSVLKNVTFYWDNGNSFSSDETKIISGANSEVIFTKNDLHEKSIKWNCYACDSFGNCGFSGQNNTLVVGRNDYYVSVSGSDSNTGTLASPFKTIQKCSETAMAGDTCFIREGTYRETVSPKNSGNELARITFKPYNNEKVTISGAEQITGWSQYSGNIYKAIMNWDLGRGQNQVFFDSKMMLLSRWPNTPSLDLLRPQRYPIESGQNLTTPPFNDFSLYNSNLTQEPNFWNNAIIFLSYSPKYRAYTGIVQSSEIGKLIFKMTRTPPPLAGYPNYGTFMLMDKLSILDSEGEWYYNNLTKELFLWAPSGGNPEGKVEAKARQLAFNLTGNKYVTIEGLNIFSAGIYVDQNCNHILLDHLNASYVNHFTIFNNPTVTSGVNLDKYKNSESGVFIDGQDNVLNNSKIQYSACNAVGMKGKRNKVLNSEISDVDYVDAYCSAIYTKDPRTLDAEIKHNKLHDSGREIVSVSNAQNLTLEHNEMYNAGVGGVATDLGIIYGTTYDYRGTKIAYNKIYNSSYSGIYFDGKEKDILIHHNLIFNAMFSAIFHSPHNVIVEQNTFIGNPYAVAGQWMISETPGKNLTIFRNNILLGQIYSRDYYYFENNLNSSTNIFFENSANNDYHLKDYSPAVDAGLNLGYTEDIEGNFIPQGARADIGVYESPYFAQESGPTASWDFEIDARDSENNYNGALMGDASIKDDPVRGKVLKLDGNGDFVNLPMNILKGKNIFSITSWFKTSTNGSIIMQYGVSGYFIYYLVVRDGKVLSCLSNASKTDCTVGKPDLSTQSGYADNKWHFAGVVSTGNEEILYIDGKEINRTSKNVLLPLGYYLNAIGLQGFNATRPMGSGYFNGSIDDVRIYTRPLSESDMQKLYSSQIILTANTIKFPSFIIFLNYLQNLLLKTDIITGLNIYNTRNSSVTNIDIQN